MCSNIPQNNKTQIFATLLPGCIYGKKEKRKHRKTSPKSSKPLNPRKKTPVPAPPPPAVVLPKSKRAAVKPKPPVQPSAKSEAKKALAQAKAEAAKNLWRRRLKFPSRQNLKTKKPHVTRPTPEEEIQIIDRQDLVWELHIAGYTVRKISEHLKSKNIENASVGTVYNDIQHMLSLQYQGPGIYGKR